MEEVIEGKANEIKDLLKVIELNEQEGALKEQ